MSVILLIIGIVVTGAGLAALGFGIPINEFTLGTTLITAGTTALCGGLLLIGLSAAVAELRRVGDLLLKGRPAGQPVRRPESAGMVQAAAPAPVPATAVAAAPAGAAPPAFGPAHAPPAFAPASAPPPSAPPPSPAPAARSVPPLAPRPRLDAPGPDVRRGEPQGAPAASVDVSAAAIERLRTSIQRPRPDPALMPEEEVVPLSPNGGPGAPARRASLEPALEPRLTPADRRGVGTGEPPVKTSRLDFLFRSRQAAPARTERPEPGRPADIPLARSAPADVAVQPRYQDTVARPAAPAPQPVSAPPPMPQEPAASTPTEQTMAILKSGVVDGMAYTLYADGSIEAKLPDGTVRFESIAELRAHIEKHP